jgi:hypothetical protein
MGLMGTVGHFMLILATTARRPPRSRPTCTAQIGFAMLGGWLVFSHVPDHWSLLGMA